MTDISYEPLRGMRDYYGEEASKLAYLIREFSRLASLAGYQEIMVPVLEEFRLFALKGGEELRESMYVFQDKGGRTVAMRPEFTPGVVRAYLNSMQGHPKPVRLYYAGTVYRYDEPQMGRLREFRQAGVENIGINNIYIDLEIIDLLFSFYKNIGLSENIKLKIGNIGILRTILYKYNIHEDRQETILHLIDKGEVQKALSIMETEVKNSDVIDFITTLLRVDEANAEDLRSLIDTANSIGLNQVSNEISYLERIARYTKELELPCVVSPSFVRGLAYYTGIIFEVVHRDFKLSLAGGGRYDNLIEAYGGRPTPAIGFAVGVERTALVSKIQNERDRKAVIFLVDEDLVKEGIQVASELRRAGITCVLNTKEAPLSKLIPQYASQGYNVALILGKKEKSEGKVTVKWLVSRTQETVERERVVDYLSKII